VSPAAWAARNQIDELNDRIVAFIKAQAAGEQAAQPARPQAAEK
jgi:hypothetical protein